MISPQHAIPEPAPVKARKTISSNTLRASMPRARTPEAVAGRRHADAQTENYLEELTDKAPEEDAATQTDAAMDRPVPPLFVPQPSGESKETQILEGELFDFDLEVEPLLEVLVGKAIDQALVEVVEEQELKAIKAQQEYFEQRRAVELAEAQRLEAADKRRMQEIARRKAQEEKRLQREREIAAKLAARSMTKDYLSNLQETVLGRLSKAGMFQDPIVQEVEHVFLPWLADATSALLAAAAVGQQLAHALVGDASASRVDARTAVMEAIVAEQRAKEAAIAAAEAEKVRAEEEAAAAARAAEEAANAPPPAEGEGEAAPAE
jgi:hypothetical protein